MLSEPLVQALAAYLRKKPYEEVADFLATMQAEYTAAKQAPVAATTELTERDRKLAAAPDDAS